MVKIVFSAEALKNILHLYAVQHMSVLAIAKKYEVNPQTITRVLKENNVEIRNNNEYKCKKVDNIFLSVSIQKKKLIYLVLFMPMDV